MLKLYIEKEFGVDFSTFIKALEMSPGSQGAIQGSITELKFKEYAISKGFEVFRIKEKPKGGYSSKAARGDFYIRKNNWPKNEGLIIENKGIKTNSEKRSGFTKKDKLINFLLSHSFDRKSKIESIYKRGKKSYVKKKMQWDSSNNQSFPNFRWLKENPGPGIPDLSNIWKNKRDFNNWIDSFDESQLTEQKYWDLQAPCRILQTHMPSSRVDPQTKIKSTGPLVGEFNIIAVDLFMRTKKHEFVFANSNNLNHQAKSPNHLQQNYTIDILVEYDNFKRHKLLHPWYDNIDDCISQTSPQKQLIDKSQLDYR